MTFLIGLAVGLAIIGIYRVAAHLDKIANGLAVLATIHLQMAKHGHDAGDLAHAAHKIEMALGLDGEVFDR